MAKPARSRDRSGKSDSGTLYVVSTPIGHLDDLSPRGVATLREVDVIAAEDTRQTRKLTSRFDANASLVSLHAHSPTARLEQILATLKAGKDVALATDAGTPGVSDPGPAMVAMARANGIRVVPIPGPSAVNAALSVSGFGADQYWFAGFPPRRGPARAQWLAAVGSASATVVCFEAPGRLLGLVRDLGQIVGPNRRMVLARELTKVFEELVALPAEEMAVALADREIRGECTLVLEPGSPPATTADDGLAGRLAQALREAGIETKRAARIIAEVTGLSRNESYRIVVALREKSE